MIRFLKYLFAVIFTGVSTLCLSQNAAKKWYFGNGSALDFTANPPANLANGVMGTWEGCSSVADGSGNLLFYTDGSKIWNASHLVMANGTGLFGGSSSAQSALIVKPPGNPGIYFVFTTDGSSNGLRYSTVDMSLAAGAGSVTVKNVLVQGSSTERLCGTMHCNGSDIWVLSHDKNSDVFRANLVTATGVNTTAVLSAIGSPLYGSNVSGCMKVSPNGKKIGNALYSPGSFELFDFNPTTGVVSNSLSLAITGGPGYGCEFSPDGTKFYGTLTGNGTIVNRLHQWDLCSGSNQGIIDSETWFGATHTGQLQLAPDGKIYQGRATITRMKVSPELTIEIMKGERQLGVIHNPNASAATVNFNNLGQSVSPAVSMYGLPNFVSGFYKTPVAQFTYNVNYATSCVKAFFTAPPLINNTCSATSYTVSSLKWLFGDPATAITNTSTLINPQHSYPGIGTYNVRLILYNVCGGVIDTLKQQVLIGPALMNNPSDFLLCAGQSLTLIAASSSPSYSWSTGATGSSIVVTPTTNTTYSLGYTDNFGCPRGSVQTITVNPIPVVTVSGKDTLCASNVFTITANGAMTYSWSTGSTNSLVKVTPLVTTVYTVTGTSFNGCSIKKTFTAVVKPSPVPSISANTVVCIGAVASATAAVVGKEDKFMWNTGMIGATFTFVPTDEQFIFSVKAIYTNGCWRYNTVRFNLVPLPVISVTGNTAICIGSVATFSVKGANTYSWSNGITDNPATFTPVVNSNYTIVGIDANNCTASTQMSVDIKPSSLTNASVSPNVTICEGDNTFLVAGGGNVYDWKPRSGLVDQVANIVLASPTVSTIYTVNISMDNECGSAKTVVVTVKPSPKISAGRDTVFNLKQPFYITASGTGTISWIWGDDIVCPSCLTTRIFPIHRTCYIAQAIASNGCIRTDEVCIDVGPEYALFIPNAFSPNGDGVNDEFYVSGFGLANVRLTIYDRWGKKLFASDSEITGWDGSFKGQPCESGVYTWYLDYVSANGLRQQKTGYVTLLQL